MGPGLGGSVPAMRRFACSVLAAVAACGGSSADSPDAAHAPDAAPDAAHPDAATTFGELGGMCGVLNAPELTGASPLLVRATLSFARAFMDPGDRPALTP